MGEIADSMINGEVCVMCGVWLKDEAYGIPRACSNECARDYGGIGIQSDGTIIYETTDLMEVVDDNYDISL